MWKQKANGGGLLHGGGVTYPSVSNCQTPRIIFRTPPAAGGCRRKKDRRGSWEAHKVTDARACSNALACARSGVCSYGVCAREGKSDCRDGEKERERERERDVGACERERERAERQQSGWTCDFIKSSSILP